MEICSLLVAEDDPKRAKILEGARKVFLAYGYGRTTMDDIARAVEMSRPALYLVFRNKTAIYRALGAELLAASIRDARAALAGDAPFPERLMQALERAIFQMMAMIENSPHGEEILDMKNSLAADLVAEWRQALGDRIAEAIAAEADACSIDLAARGVSANGLSDMLLDGLDGMKARGIVCEAARAHARELVNVASLALRP